ncbi:MAG TPA: LacI family transcriptional regulator [Firmicutes bacterium]|nr:LacI family transcriptional regulator [Bacillota bacterium]
MDVTIKDVAKRAGVSTATVSRVLNGSPYVQEHLASRVREAIAELGYRRNAAARSLKTKKTNTIGVLVPDISNPYFMQISKGLEDVLAPHGFSLIFASSDEDSRKEAKLLRVLSEYRVDCLVVATAGGNDELLKDINGGGLPVVLVDRLPPVLAGELDYVVEDNHSSAYQLVHHFLEQGARSFGLIHGPMSATTALERAFGCRAALAEGKVPPERIVEYHGDFSQASGQAAVRLFLQGELPDAVLALNNSMAWGAILELSKHKLRIGEDVLLGSYGAVDAAPLLPFSITYVDQNPRELGERVGEVVRERLVSSKQGHMWHVMQQKLRMDRPE